MSFTLVSWSNDESLRAVNFMIAHAGRFQLHHEQTHSISPVCGGKCKHMVTGCSVCRLPYVTDGLTEARGGNFWDLHRYVARKLGKELYPTRPDVLQACVRVEELINDLRISFENGIYSEDYTLEFRHRQRELASKIDDWMTSREYLVGSSPTYLDFVLYQLLLRHDVLFPLFVDLLPNIKAYFEGIQNIPKIWSYLQTLVYNDRAPNTVSLSVRPKLGIL